MPVFPSVEWFDTVKTAANDNPDFRGLGTNDTRLGVKVGDQIVQLDFYAFECANVAEITEDDLYDVDFYLDMEPDRWQSFIQHIQANGAADAQHTFNTLDLSEPGGIIKSHDPYRMNNFFRFHLTIQKFFDSAATVETTY
ncbi:MAG: hypothetical protein QF898_12265 [SAR202 cluster bacterium]|jgi:hypothetical protein|nr:hypothetical protein [SAR202 cluster bacterium]MDP6512064.1 hypothetical protein [SAR202 cluster bacterium]MDP6716806.1 hypothetical protein [SAR202 cluster bacterium]|tara:strand:+ start:81 stop:500 length:420 start_codon:yes stop_codon:yes gene_type:complete